MDMFKVAAYSGCAIFISICWLVIYLFVEAFG